MHTLERLEGQFLALVRRVEKIELWQRSAQACGSDAAAAAAVAGELALDAGVLVMTSMVAARKRLALELRGRGWSAARIARVLNCCERTAERWLQR